MSASTELIHYRGLRPCITCFVCKYHSWAFLPDGTLNFAPDKEDFPEGNPCGKVRLQELRCETFAGFIFVNMDPDCKGLRKFLGPIWEDWERETFIRGKEQWQHPCGCPAIGKWFLTTLMSHTTSQPFICGCTNTDRRYGEI